MKCFNFFAFLNALDLNNQKILCLTSVYQFERTGTNLNNPKDLTVVTIYCFAWPHLSTLGNVSPSYYVDHAT